MKNIILTVFLVFIFGCASNISNYDSRQISTGMTKEEVVRVIGEPQRVSASRGIETYEYDLKGKAYKACMGGIAVVTLGMAAADHTPSTKPASQVKNLIYTPDPKANALYNKCFQRYCEAQAAMAKIFEKNQY